MPAPPETAPPETAPHSRAWALLLMVPAVIVWLVTAVRPTLRLIVAAFTDNAGVSGRHGFTLDNFHATGLGGSLATALPFFPVPLLLFVGLGLILGATGRRAGTGSRLAGRVLIALPAACFVPAAAAYSWGLSRDVVPGRWVLILVGAFGFLATAATTAYLAAFRGGRPAVLVVTGLAVLTSMALALQQFTIPYLLSDPATLPNGGLPPVLLTWSDSSVFAIGAMAGILVVTATITAVLGVAAVALIVVTGTGLAATPPAAAARTGARWAYLGVAAAVLAAGVVLLIPWLSRLGNPVLPHDDARIWSDTWLAPIPTTVVAVAVAVPAGFAIGALRPFGDRSGWLLLPFAPWLFVGAAPYALAAVLPHLSDDKSAEAASLTPPTWFSAAALVFFTLLFRGQEPAYRHGRSFVDAYVRPLWPAVPLAAVVLWVTQANDDFWPLMTQVTIRPSPGFQATTLDVYQAGVQQFADGTAVLTPVPMILFAVAVLVAAQFFVERLSVVTLPAVRT